MPKLNRLFLMFLLVVFVAACGGTTTKFGNLNEPRRYPIPGFGGEYVYRISFSDYTGREPLPIERAEGRGASSFAIGFHENNLRRDVSVSVSLNTIRFTNLQTGQVYTTRNVIDNRGHRIFTDSRPDLPLGDYQIDFSGRFCANGVCKNFSQSLQKTLFLDSKFYSRF